MNSSRDVAKALLRSITANGLIGRALLNIAHTGLLPGQIWERIPYEGAFRLSLPGGCGFTCEALV